MLLGAYLQGLVDLVAPPACLICAKKLTNEQVLCTSCRTFKRNLPPFCPKCGRTKSLRSGKISCNRCLGADFSFTQAISPFIFTPPLADLIYLFKYKGFSSLASFFADRICEFLKEVNLPLKSYDLVSFVPLHQRKIREREYNQSYLLAKGISGYSRLPLVSTLKVKTYLSPQISKNYKRRKDELSGNFQLNQDIKAKNIILVDDVFTTGATVSECSQALKQNGAEKILIITLATVLN